MATPFQTPQNEQSFSSLIDEVILATGKPGQLISAVQAARLTIRECQALALFARDLVEDQITATASPNIWSRPAYFRILRTVQYDASKIYPDFILPGKKQKDETDYFYAADDYFVFAGVTSGDLINVATYYWATPLTYFGRLGVTTTQFPGGPYDIRPAYYDLDLGMWQYLNVTEDGYVDTTGDTDEDELRRRQATNWLVSDWRELIISGTKAKIFNGGGDPRGPTEYSIYKQTQKVLQSTSGYEAEGF